MTEEKTSAKTGAAAQIKFVFNHCNDVKAMRRFYGELIGLKESAYNEEWGYLCFETGGFEFMFFQSETPIEIPTEFSDQPGYQGGALKNVSWAVEVPEARLAEVVKRLKQAGARAFNDVPDWRQDSYWGYSVLDPMGVTVEVYSIPARKPEPAKWPA